MRTVLMVGRGARRRARAWTAALPPGGRVVVACDPTAYRLYGREVMSGLRRCGRRPAAFRLASGEAAKTWPQVERLLSFLLAQGCDRSSAVAALGGSAVTDAAGFAAAVFMRGIPWISLPTTLLGQVDGGLGGKTAINLRQGKNLAGAFHQPAAVVCDTETLGSLPRRELVSGLAEVLKYGLVFDPGFWNWTTRRWAELLEGGDKALEQAVRRAARWKLSVVAQDERETAGRRILLNFGHTLGHALEKEAGFGRLRHGEAVIWGMRAALRLSVKHAGLPRARYQEAENFLSALPVRLPSGLSASRLLAAARSDKKARRGEIAFVLLRDFGRPAVRAGLPERDVRAVVEDIL